MIRTVACLVTACVALLGCAAARGAEVLYTVQPGDHLTSISRSYLIGGETLDNIRALATLNGLRDPNYIVPGTMLRIPLERVRMTPQSARVADTYGAATVDGKPAARGATLGPASRVQTGPAGGVLVELADGSKIWVRADTDATLDTLQAAPAFDHAETDVRISSGRIETFVNRLRGTSRFEIRSPTPKLGVRGTEFRVGVEGVAGSRLEVLEGRVGASGAQASAAAPVEVPAGFGVVVDASGQTSAPTRLLDAPDVSGLPALLERPLVRFAVPALAGARRFRGEVAEEATGYIVASQLVDGTDLRFADLPDGRYRLIVRAADPQGLEGRDASHAFTLKARPEPPFPSAPPDRSRSRGESGVALAWTRAADAATYRVQIATDAEFRALALDRTDIAATTLDAPLPAGEYHWRVASIDAQRDQGPFGDARRFELRPGPGAPAAPKLDRDRVSFSWPAEPGQTFDFELARDERFTQLVRTERLSTPAFELATPEPGTYYMRVRAIDPDGFVGPYASSQSFTVEPKPFPGWLLLVPVIMMLLL